MLLLFSSFEAGICAQKLVTSLEDILGVPYCEIAAPNRLNLKNKNFAQTNDCLCYSQMQVVH